MTADDELLAQWRHGCGIAGGLFVLPVEEAIRIRTAERGDDAL